MLKRLSIKYKIGFIALIGLAGFVIFQAVSYRLSINVRDQLQDILNEDFAILKFANQAQILFVDLDKHYQASLAEADPDTLRDADNKAMQIKLRFEVIRGSYALDDPLFAELFNAFVAYSELTSNHTAAVLTNSLSYENTLSGYARVNLLRERYYQLQQQFIEERYHSFEDKLVEIEKEEEALVRFGLLLGILLSLILLLFSMLIIRSLIKAFNNAVNVAEQVASGNLEQAIEIYAEDETGQLLHSLNAMRDALKRQYDDNHRQEKVQGFLAGLNETMRGDKTLQELADGILAYLTRQLYAQHGAFYLLQGNTLHLVAGYARPAGEQLPEQVALGESLLGQVAEDQEARIITDVPDGYVRIDSSLGHAMPRSILLAPVVFEGRLKAVIEIAAFHRFGDDDLQLLELCNDAIAIAINSAQARFEVADMLEKTRNQAEELQRQRQELAQFNRQLEEKTRDLDQQKNQILQKNRELEESRHALIEKSAALEQSGRYKSQFLSTMSHELRTPLNSILILSQALVENRKGNLDERDTQHARVIHTAGGELLALINDILDLSKVEEGKMDVIIDEIDVHGLAASLTQQFEFQARQKGLEYRVDVADDAPAIFYSDRHRLTQILKNFISNAIKFTDRGGVYVEIGPSQRGSCEQCPDSGSCIEFRVRDTGVGIDKSKQDLVFEAFKQADGTTSRKYGGTGLGLTISRELARLLGGQIQLRSEGSGKGSSFSLLLPVGSVDSVSDAGPDNQPALPVPAAGPVAGNILVVEDNPVFQEVLRAVFASHQLDVAIAANGSSALQQLAERRFDCLVVDLNLPDYDGLELLRQIRSLDDYQQQPVIVFTAEDLDSERRNAVLQYANRVSTKSPRAVIEICETVTGWLRQRAPAAVAGSGQLRGRRVLLVDDDERNLYSIGAVLENEGIKLISVKSGRQALTVLESNDGIELVLLDIMMPEMDGYDVLDRIRANPAIRHLPVITLTAKAMVGDREKCLAHGATAYLSKPVEGEALLQAIARYIDLRH